MGGSVEPHPGSHPYPVYRFIAHTCVAANHVSLPCPAAPRTLFLSPHPAPATRWVRRLFESSLWACFVFPLGLCLGSAALLGLLRVPFGFAVGLLWVSSGSALGVRFGGSHFGSASGLLWVIFVVFALRVRPLGLLWVCVGSALGLHRVRFTSALFILWVCFGFTLGLLCG